MFNVDYYLPFGIRCTFHSNSIVTFFTFLTCGTKKNMHQMIPLITMIIVDLQTEPLENFVCFCNLLDLYRSVSLSWIPLFKTVGASMHCIRHWEFEIEMWFQSKHSSSPAVKFISNDSAGKGLRLALLRPLSICAVQWTSTPYKKSQWVHIDYDTHRKYLPLILNIFTSFFNEIPMPRCLWSFLARSVLFDKPATNQSQTYQ